MRLLTIPKDKYDEYRLNLIFDCYKWDPQFQDNNTVAKHVLVITKEEHEELKILTEKLDKETLPLEKGKTGTIKATVLPEKATNKTRSN